MFMYLRWFASENHLIEIEIFSKTQVNLMIIIIVSSVILVGRSSATSKFRSFQMKRAKLTEDIHQNTYSMSM